MQIHNNNGGNIIDWYFSYLLKQSQKRVLNISVRDNSRDTVVLSGKAKRELKNADIEKQIQSGEPITGVTYEEYCDYYYDKHGYRNNYNMEHEYRQALKGDNASLREREWRTNPEYRIPVRLYNSPEVTADREAAFEKFRNGEELTEWEKSVMSTFENGFDYCAAYEPAMEERKINIAEGRISGALSDAGISLSEDTELTFEVWGRSITVTGNADDSTLEAVQKAVFGIDVSKENYSGMGYTLQSIWYCAHDDYEADGFDLGFLQKAEELLQDEGSGVTVFDLGVDESGNVTGLPESLDSFIKENAIGRFGSGVPEEYLDKEKDVLSARYMKESFVSAVRTVQNGDYDRIRSMTCTLTYKNGVLSC